MPANSRKLRERDELRRIADDATLNRAFQLAHSIYSYRKRDRKVALNVISEALRAIEVRLMAQDEADRHDPQKPTKVRWSAAQWLQFLIYCKSERYEKEQESDGLVLLTEADMVIRYIKHLILITCRRNSFHVTLGLSRLLYDYSTSETMAIYDLVFQDPDTSTRKADAYYRDRKNKLIEELQERFHRFVRLYQGPRGENRFQAQQDPAQFTDLVDQYLKLFTPWEARCALPEPLSEWSTIPDLQSNQVSQIHSVIHPPCFSKLVKALRLNPPKRRLAVPRFFLKSRLEDRTPPSGDSFTPSDLTRKEISGIRKTLDEDKRRRRKFSPRLLSVLIDGVERATLDLTQSSQIRLDVEDDAKLIQFVGSDEYGELMLGTHILGYEDDVTADQSPRYSVVLEGGQKISLALLPTEGGAGTDSRLIVDIQYSGSNAAKLVWLSWERIGHKLSYARPLKRRWNIAPLTVKVALGLLAMALFGAMLYFALRGRPTEQQQVAKEEPPPSVVEQGKPASKSSPGVGPTEKPPVKSPGGTGPPSSRAQSGGATREQSTSPVRSLASVRQIYVESFGDDTFGRAVRQAIIEKLRTASGFVVTDVANDADTAVTGSSRLLARGEVGTGQITVALVNVSGDVIWQARKYRGTAEQIAAQFTKDLLEAIRRSEGKRQE